MSAADTNSRVACVEVPGTTSNFGSGFDCLGAALSVSNRVSVTDSGIKSEPAHPFVDEAVDLFFAQDELDQHDSHGISWRVEGSVPRSRGLGSSVTLRLGILAGLNELHGGPLTRIRLFHLCAELEGHPDNAGPATFGGFFVGPPDSQPISFPISDQLRFVTLVRKHEVETGDARQVLPTAVPFQDAVASVGMVAGIVAAFASQDYEGLTGLFQDRLHEPYRSPLNPGLEVVKKAGEEAGAYCGFLSGSGSTIICLARAGEAESVGKAMLDACEDEDRPDLHLLKADNLGLRTAS